MVNHGGLGVNNTMYDAQGRCVLNGPKHVQGLEKWLALYQQDKVSPPASATTGSQDQTNAFNAGQLGMVMGWGAYLTTLPAGIGGILGSALPLVLALGYGWQVAVLLFAALLLFLARRGVVLMLIAAGLAGTGAALLGAPVG